MVIVPIDKEGFSMSFHNHIRILLLTALDKVYDRILEGRLR